MMHTEKQPHIHLQKEQIQPVCVLVNAPERVTKIAEMCESSKFLSENRENRSYELVYNNEKIMVISFGIGSPNMAIVIEELVALGVKVLIFAGTCGRLKKEIEKNTFLIPIGSAKLGGSTVSIAPDGFPCVPTPHMVLSLKRHADKRNAKYPRNSILLTNGVVYPATHNVDISSDVFSKWGALCDGVDPQTAALYEICRVRNVDCASISLVTYSPIEKEFGDPAIAPDNPFEESIQMMCRIALDTAAELRKEL